MELILDRYHSAQQIVADSKARYKVLCCGRRWGKSRFCANEILSYLYSDLRPKIVWIVAPTYELTTIIINIIKDIAKHLIVKSNDTNKEYQLLGGHIIEGKSGETGTLIGRAIDLLIIDECARLKEETWTQELSPTLIDREGKVIFISTPLGRNWYYRLYMDALNDETGEWAAFTFPTATNPYLPAEEVIKMKKKMPDIIFKQEILAEFLDDATSFFRSVDDIILTPEDYEEDDESLLQSVIFTCNKCKSGLKQKQVPINNFVYCKLCHQQQYVANSAPIYITGVDLARKADYTVLTTICYYNNKLKVIDIDRFNNIDWDVQKARIINHQKRYDSKIIIDGTGVGDPIAQDLQINNIPLEVIVYTNKIKREMMTKLSILIENKQIKIPDNKILINELKSFELNVTQSGNLTFSSPTTDDMVNSLALAVYGAPTILTEELNKKYNNNNKILNIKTYV
jgi:hypothetical protein